MNGQAMTTHHNIPMGKVQPGDLVIRHLPGQPFGRVQSITPDGTDVAVVFEPSRHVPSGVHYLPADQRVTVDRPSRVVDLP